MTKTNKIIVVSILAFILWSVGIFTIYKITWIPKRSITGVMIVKRPMKRTSSGKFVKMGFIEANASYLFLLTVVCAGAVGYAIKKIKKNGA